MTHTHSPAAADHPFKTMNTIIAIDPGVSGGIAVRHHTADVTVYPMPETDSDIRDLLAEIVRNHYEDEFSVPIAVIEDLPKTTGGNIPESRVFVMARNFGYVVAVCDTLNLEVKMLPPKKWQKLVGAGVRGSRSKTEWKNHLKQLAQRLHPTMKVTLKTADALLLLEAHKKETTV
jgi:hypothetical protein